VISRVQVWLASALLLGYSFYVLTYSLPQVEFGGIAFGLLALAAAVALMLRSPWCRPLTLALSLAVISYWLLVSFSGPSGAYLAQLSPREIVISLLPGLLLCLLAAYCSYVSLRVARAIART
jgi:hypothetical protein